MQPRHPVSLAVAIAVGLLAGTALRATQPAPTAAQRVDRIFARWSATTPGCAVGAAVKGTPVLTKAYGMADLEHDVASSPDTIFEAGSVSKQFTAAAVLLLVRDGKLTLDDPVRKYLPEVPDYGAPLTIRHMLNHTSGLRDWGSVESVAGWPRTTRAYTHEHVLDIVSRQRALNFPSGTRWSYSNTGFNLAAILVSRVSGMPFPEFTRTRIFEPLGMSRTSWRDDHTRIVKGRAIAYSDDRDGFHTEMPFEDVHGNGGLLTTVGDLLRWNENFETPRVGDAAFVTLQQQPGAFSDGQVHNYAFGLQVGTYKGVREVGHSGSTAGYRAHLVRYPDQRVSVAVLCNVSSGNATQAAHAVADVYLGSAIHPDAGAAPAHALTAAEADAVAGLYRNAITGAVTRVVREKDGVRLERGGALVAMSGAKFVTAGHDTWEFNGGAARATDEFGRVIPYERVPPAAPSDAQLHEYAGVYVSEEAETTFVAAVDGGALVLRRRPASTLKLTPLYADAFSAPQLGTVVFRRDAAGRIKEFSVSQDRVWDLRFVRQGDTKTTSP
jgi:CubicO group peptidase (beta-lactamase class C family)